MSVIISEVPKEAVLSADTTITDTANDTLASAPAVGQIFVCGLFVTNASTDTATLVNFKQDTTTFFSHYAAAEGGFGFNYDPPIPWGSGNDLVVANGTNSSNTNIQATYFIA